MKFILLLLTATAVAAQTTPPSPNLGLDLFNSFINSDLVQSKIDNFYRLLDLKVRFVRLLNAFLARSNLLLIRRSLDFLVRVFTYVIGFLPEPEDDADKAGFVNFLAPLLAGSSPAPRVDRALTNFTTEDRELFEKHKDDVVHVAELIYNTPN